MTSKSHKYTAVNKDGFEVDIIRSERMDDDPHPIQMSDEDDDFWVVHELLDKYLPQV